MSILSLNDGPQCARCGLAGSDPIPMRVRGSRRYGGTGGPCKVTSLAYRYQCANCGNVWWDTMPRNENGGADVANETANEPEADKVPSGNGVGGVVFHLVRCPKCQGENTRVTSTRRPIRFHKCKDCGHTFKSHEQ